MQLRSQVSEQVRSAGARALEWLVATRDRLESDATLNPRHIFQILVGLWICEQGLLEDQSYTQTRAYIENIDHFLPEDTDAAMDLLYADPALVLFSLGILRFFDAHNQLLELFAQKISDLLQGHADEHEDEASQLFLVRFLLQRLHLHTPLPAYPLHEMAAAELIKADDATVELLVKNIAATTQFGQITRGIEADVSATLSSLLPVVMLDYLRMYNLEAGMQVLRGMRYLHLHEGRGKNAGLDFLLAQQQTDGRFGFLASEIAQIPDAEQPTSVDLSIYLPLTVSFLWTIAESAHPQFVLAWSF